ncbi:MAG TPA: HlyD family efflux transporter periplasmic adaptor subunit [Vicinamibacterales bacterium]|nr:HlyD family efflux transporter periplasmic adaptor subunit [Vicinamibacterales bacterium]
MTLLARRPPWLIGLGAAAVLGSAWAALSRRTPPEVPTATVTRGEFIDDIQIRGEIRALRSVTLTAPSQAGELLIVRLARDGSAVKPGDVVVEFDGLTLRRTVQEKRTELRQAEAEIEDALAKQRIIEEQHRTALLKARYDVERASLDLGDPALVPRLEFERAKLALDDARHRLAEAERKAEADRASAEADLASRRRRRDTVAQDLARAERSLAALVLRAPVAGVVTILPNFRSGTLTAPQPFREGDRAWAGAAIVELPELSSMHLLARLDEIDRARVGIGQRALVRVDALPDRELAARVAEISLLTKVDFSGGWPPSANFDIKLAIDQPDSRLRPGMSATARIVLDRRSNALLVPARAVFSVEGQPTVYRLAGTRFEPRRVDLAARNREHALVRRGLEVGDRVALTPPAEPAPGRAR